MLLCISRGNFFSRTNHLKKWCMEGSCNIHLPFVTLDSVFVSQDIENLCSICCFFPPASELHYLCSDDRHCSYAVLCSHQAHSVSYRNKDHFVPSVNQINYSRDPFGISKHLFISQRWSMTWQHAFHWVSLSSLDNSLICKRCRSHKAIRRHCLAFTINSFSPFSSIISFVTLCKSITQCRIIMQCSDTFYRVHKLGHNLAWWLHLRQRILDWLCPLKRKNVRNVASEWSSGVGFDQGHYVEIEGNWLWLDQRRTRICERRLSILHTCCCYHNRNHSNNINNAWKEQHPL